MVIHNNKTVKDLQIDFQKVFPYLKIEFYKSIHRPGEATIEEDPIPPDFLIKEIRSLDSYGVMNLDGTQKTSDFENILATVYGLNVQVFRKSYGTWLQTWATDIWTLQEQNDRSAIMGEKHLQKGVAGQEKR